MGNPFEKKNTADPRFIVIGRVGTHLATYIGEVQSMVDVTAFRPTSFAQWVTAVATLAGSFASTSAALAADPMLPQASAPSLAITSATLAPYLLLPPPLPTEHTLAAPDMDRMFAEAAPAVECQKPCGAASKKGPKLADELLNELGTVPVLGTVMTPVTRGLMIPTGEGAPPLELAVAPTRITRGSGVVAIARF